MGNFRIEIEAVGSHMVDREVKDGGIVNFNADGYFTPDALAKRFVEELEQTGASMVTAKIIHWPDQSNTVTDDLVTGKRKEHLNEA